MAIMSLRSDSSMSNRQYHAQGCPSWWARIGSGESAQFLEVGRNRGDRPLDVTVDVPDGTAQVHIGVGRGKHGVRETIECELNDRRMPQ